MIDKAIFLAVAAGAYWHHQRKDDPAAPKRTVGQAVEDAAKTITGKGWRLPPEPLAGLIRQHEDANGIPRNLLARLLWQESRYNAKARNARSGAQGIAQIMPATGRAPGFGVTPIADPYNAAQAVRFAGQYLKAMRNYTGSWALALAAYNWGPGNAKNKPSTSWPTETRTYVAQITADVPTGQA